MEDSKAQKEYFWHSLSPEEIFQRLGVDPNNGLTTEEVKTRQKKFGRNSLPEAKPFSKLALFFEQFRSPLIYILIIAGIVVLFCKEFIDFFVIIGAVLLNTTVGFFQELKANNALRELKKAVKHKAEVIRDGNPKIVDTEEIVPGDIFVLKSGMRVPADGRIIESKDLQVNEMIITGEWVAAHKKPILLPKETPLADRDNMVFMGTIVESGVAKVVATATGKNTEIGKITQMVKEQKEEKTPLQKKLAKFAKIVTIVILFICFFIFIEELISGGNFFESFIISVAVAVAAIPEGLPVAITVILALGARRILRRKGLVRKLSSAEALGSTSIIATDKTGTLTEGKMRVAEIITETNLERKLALQISVMCNEAFIENPEEMTKKWIIRGRPTDKALLLAGLEAGINQKELSKRMIKIAEIPFNSENKYLARVFTLKREKEDILYLSGAPEKVLALSRYIRKRGKEELLTKEYRKKIELELENLTRKGLRVVAVAYKKVDNLKDIIKNMVFVGLIALKDPVRKEVKDALKLCKKAGMRVIIVTGDHKLTAKAVAEELGFSVSDEEIIEGKDLEKMTDDELFQNIENFQIYARVEPKHKLRIINAWQEKGEVIAMTGDGVNDAPALKKADIGIALGSGTDVAKEVSDLVLLDDNFRVIVSAVEEGRGILDNIRKVVTYLFSDSFSETILISLALLFGFPLPVSAVQILWVNLIEDGFPNVALAFEPKEKDLMLQKPKKKKSSLLTDEMKSLIFIIGLITDLLLFGLFFWLYKFSDYGISHIRTIIFSGLAIDSLFYIFSCKSLRKNIWEINLFSNKIMIFAWIFGWIMLLCAIYLPPFQVLLKTVPLNIYDWGLLIGLGVINIILVEITKWHFIVKKQ